MKVETTERTTVPRAEATTKAMNMDLMHKTSQVLNTPVAVPRKVQLAMRILVGVILAILFSTALYNVISRQFVWDLDVQKQTAAKFADKTDSFGQVLLNRDGKIVSWNKGMTDLTGYNSKEMRGTTLARLDPHNPTSSGLEAIGNPQGRPWKAWGYLDLKTHGGENIMVRANVRDIPDPKDPDQVAFRRLTIDRVGEEQILPGSKSLKNPSIPALSEAEEQRLIDHHHAEEEAREKSNDKAVSKQD